MLSPISYEAFRADVAALAASIVAEGWRPAFIVGIGRGGIAPALWLSHALDLPMLSVDLSAGQPAFGEALLARLAARAAAGERLLLVDDINDSGATIAGLRRALAEGAANVRFAVLLDNIASPERVTYRVRTIDRRSDQRWFVFPWEAMADSAAIARDAEESGRLD